MSINTSTEVIGAQEWLDPVAKTVQSAVRAAYQKGGETGLHVRDALHGAWLGHPLHVALTDIPIGAWTTAVVIDALESATGREELGPGADAAIGFGIAGAIGAAVTGLTDYQHVAGAARRVGLVHGLLNVATTGLFTASLIARRRGSRGTGKILSLIGIGIGTFAARLGGELVYLHKVGMDHSDRELYPLQFTPVMKVSDLADGEAKRVEVHGEPLLVARRGQSIFALAERCSHLGGPLSEGKITATTVQCPWHGSVFSLEDGTVMNGPSVYNQPCMEVRIVGDQIQIRRETRERETVRTEKAA